MDETKKYLVNVESNLDEYAQKADEARKRVDEFIAANADLLDKNKEMTPEMERRAAQLKVLQQDYKNSQKAVENATRADKAQVGSYEQLYQAWKNAQTQLKLMGNAYVVNEKGVRTLSQEYLKQSKIVADAKKSLDSFGRGVNDNRLNVGNYTDSIKAAMGEMNMMPGALGQAAGGVQRLSVAFKALLANPIVLVITAIVGALTALFKAFKSTDSGGTELAARLEQLKAIVDVFRQRLILLTRAIGHVFKGEWKEAGEDFKNTFVDIGEAIKGAAEAGYDYQEMLDVIKDAESNYISQSAEIRRQIAKLEYTAQDRSKSTEERRAALKEAIRLSEIELATQKNLAKRKLEAEAAYLAGKNGLRKEDIIGFLRMTDAEQANASESLKTVRDNNEAKFDELEKFYAAWIDLDTRFFEENRRNLSKMTGFDEQIKKSFEDLKKADLEFIESAAKMVNAEVDKLLKVQELREQGLIQNEEYYDNQGRLIEQSVKLSDWETAEYIKNQQLKLQSSADVFSALSMLMGQQTEAGKAFAVAAATIDTYAAAAKTLNDPTIPSTVVRIAMMAAVILRGLANVKQILSVKMGSTPSSSAPSSISASPPAQRAFATPVGSSIFTRPQMTQEQINAMPIQGTLTADDIARALAKLPPPIVTVEDINARSQAMNKVSVRATI